MADIARMVEVANQLVVAAHHFLKVEENQNKRGGYITVVNHLRGGELVLVAKVGQVGSDKCLKYRTLSAEKAWRLFRNPSHQTSFETRDVNAWVKFQDFQKPLSDAVLEKWGHWAGAVRGHRYIWSFSSFPEMLDEAMMFVMAIKMGDLKKSWVLEHFASRNEYLVPFLAECYGPG